MFQLWKLVLLCGLLTGTSASLFGNLGNLGEVIEKGRELVEDTVETVVGNLREDLTRLRSSKVGQLSGKLLQKAEDLLGNAVSQILSVNQDILGLKIDNVQFLGIQTKLTADGNGLNLTLPVGADVELKLPLIGKTARLRLLINILNIVGIQTKDGKPTVVLTECGSDPGSISLSLLDSRSELANRFANAASSFLTQTLSTMMQVQVCPLVRLFVSTLGVDFVQGTIDKLQAEIGQQSVV